MAHYINNDLNKPKILVPETKKPNKILSAITNFWPTLRGGGNVLEATVFNNGVMRPVLDQTSVKMAEPFGSIPRHIKERASGWSQIANMSHDFSMVKVQAALRAAERGDMTMLFAFYRDFFLSNGMVASELSKRKLSTISEPFSILPADKTNQDDVVAAEVIKEALDRCPSFRKSLNHLMNAIIYPVAVVEKTFEPIDETYGLNKYNLRYKIKQLYPVDYNVITYRLPYLPQGPINTGTGGVITVPPLTQNITGRPEDTIWDPDSWEPNLRFWSVFQNGLVSYSYATMMAPDPNRHMVYRCNMLEGIARENWGGLGRAVLWWTIMSQLGADKFLQCLQKYGVPFILAKVDTSQVDTVNQIYEAFNNLNIVNAMAVNKDALVELVEMNMSNASDAHSTFLQFCHDQISLLICGQTLSSNAKSTGLGSGVADLQSSVREDFIKYDRLSLADILEHQLFRQYLDINGIKGMTPKIVWGSSNNEEENAQLSNTLYNLSKSGITVDDDALEELSVKFGYKLLRAKEKTDDGNDNTKNEQDNGKSDKSGSPNDKT